MAKEFDLVVIGSGPGGYVAAIYAAQLGLKTACIEKDKTLGGTCLNVGCIPSKCLLHSSEFYSHTLTKAKDHGIEIDGVKLNFSQMQTRKENVVKGFNQGIGGLFKKNKIESIQGLASFTSPNSIEVNGEEIRAKNFLIATGSEPTPLPFLPFDETKVLSSTGALALKEVPKKMIVVGAGIIGVELGSVYKRLGAEVQFIEFLDRICPTLDGGVSKAFEQLLKKQGLAFQLSSKVTKANVTNSGVEVTYQDSSNQETTLSADVMLVSIGRKPYTQALNLEKAGITPDQKGFIPIDGRFRTSVPHIYAIGDVTGGAMLAHKASEEGIAAVELMVGKTAQMDYITIPSVVYTHPEVASVGLTEEECKTLNLDIQTGQFPFKANSRARCVDDDDGFVKILCQKSTGQIIGVHIIGANAGELIEEGGLAIQKKTTALELASLSHAHPTLSEALKEAALVIAHGKAIHT